METRHLDELIERIPQLEAVREPIHQAFELMANCFEKGGKLLICGNGGSAADAEHFSGELLKGFEKKRPVRAATLPPDLQGKIQDALPVIPLVSFCALNTAFANDVDARLAFAQLTWALGRPGDILLGISTSGNAENVLQAVRCAKARGMATLGLTGRAGGALAREVDLAVRVPADRTRLIQEYHLPVYHTWCLMLEEHFWAE
ncbi:MAG: SIS domain-containing protein [Lentisphaerae bacterium]|nr:MAG: SIS domain-containing protein [Lentisphaerota bacterium]